MPAATVTRPDPDAWRDRRVVIVVAHPDDEVLGCGALLATLRDARVVQVTDGAPQREADRSGQGTASDYRAARRAESIAALALAGVAAVRLTNLGIVDQEAAAHLVPIAHRLARLLAGADVVLTHAFEGGHPDHDAVAFAVHAAARLCGAGATPTVVEMPYYYGDDAGWVRQRFLPVPGESEPRDVMERELTPDERRLKARMVAAHRTQAETLASFALDTERFRTAPPHDFTSRPHAGPLLYERHGWNLTWPAWQAQARAALAALGVSG